MGCVRISILFGWKAFILQTDNQSLTFLSDAKSKNDRIISWALVFQGYDYTVKGIPGKDNMLADYINRIVMDSEESSTFLFNVLNCVNNSNCFCVL